VKFQFKVASINRWRSPVPKLELSPQQITPRRLYITSFRPLLAGVARQTWEDPLDLARPLPLFPQAGQNPLSIGHDDLNPVGLGSSFTPLPGSIGPDGLPRSGIGSSQGEMFMDMRGRGRGQRPPGVPPGGRWDPIGPGRGPPVGVVGLTHLVGIWMTIS
jgi:hypothetical protein